MGKFGSGHRFGMNFSTNGSLYSVDTLSLQYNLSDASLFPEANSSGEEEKLLWLSAHFLLISGCIRACKTYHFHHIKCIELLKKKTCTILFL